MRERSEAAAGVAPAAHPASPSVSASEVPPRPGPLFAAVGVLMCALLYTYGAHMNRTISGASRLA